MMACGNYNNQVGDVPYWRLQQRGQHVLYAPKECRNYIASNKVDIWELAQ